MATATKQFDTFLKKGAAAQRAVNRAVEDQAGSPASPKGEVGELMSQFFGERKPGTFMQLPVDSLHPSKTNPRKAFSKEELEELARSIQSEGILQPLVVRPAGPGMAEIVTGERRWRAAQLAKLESVACIVRELDDAAALDAQIAENLQRQDITPLEEAAAYRARLKAAGDSGHKMSVDQLAERIGKSRRYVYDKLQLLDLGAAAKRALEAGKISAAYASELVRLNPEMQEQALEVIGFGVDTLAQLRDWIAWEKREAEAARERAELAKQASSSGAPVRYQRPAEDLARERRARAIAEARNQALRQIVAKVRAWNIRDVAVALAERTRFEGQKVCCRILGLVQDRATPSGGFDYRRMLRKHIENADGAALQRAIAALSLVPEDGFTASTFTWSGGKERLAALYAAGRKVGVDVKRMERELAAARSKRAKVRASAQKAKAAKR